MATPNKIDRSKLYPDPTRPQPGGGPPSQASIPQGGGPSMTAMLAGRRAGPPGLRAAAPGGRQAPPSGGPSAPPPNTFLPQTAMARSPEAPMYSVMQQPWMRTLFGGGAIAPQPTVKTQRLQAGGPISRASSPSSGQKPDDVPAMLTAGEYVIPRKAAQAIGPGNLQRMAMMGRKSGSLVDDMTKMMSRGSKRA
jgi:hypothetical protein